MMVEETGRKAWGVYGAGEKVHGSVCGGCVCRAVFLRSSVYLFSDRVWALWDIWERDKGLLLQTCSDDGTRG